MAGRPPLGGRLPQRPGAENQGDLGDLDGHAAPAADLATNRLIDLIVYRLYELVDGEVTVVESH